MPVYAMTVSAPEPRHGKGGLMVGMFSGDGDMVLSRPARGGLPAQLPGFRRSRSQVELETRWPYRCDHYLGLSILYLSAVS